jgi:hypothetical protein
VIFGYMTFFLAYYIKYLCMVKAIYVILIQLPFYEKYMHKHAEDGKVETISLIFGLNFSKDKGSEMQIKQV